MAKWVTITVQPDTSQFRSGDGIVKYLAELLDMTQDRLSKIREAKPREPDRSDARGASGAAQVRFNVPKEPEQ